MLKIPLILLTFSHAALATELSSCRELPNLAGDCVRVWGRLSFPEMTNAKARLWPVGTKRLKVVSKEAKPAEGVVAVVAKQSLHTAAWGYFTYCPLEQEVPKKAQPICLENAENVSFVSR